MIDVNGKNRLSAIMLDVDEKNRLSAIIIKVDGKRIDMYCVCKSCMDQALDEFVDEYEDAPDVVDLKETQFADWDPPRKCDFCDDAAVYLVV